MRYSKVRDRFQLPTVNDLILTYIVSMRYQTLKANPIPAAALTNFPSSEVLHVKYSFGIHSTLSVFDSHYSELSLHGGYKLEPLGNSP